MIELVDLEKTFNADGHTINAVRPLTLSVGRGEFFTLLGPSGCGKTTTLRMIAGLVRPDAGSISIGGHTVFSSAEGLHVPAHHRDLGMVFQSLALWPHMSVQANVGYPLRARRRSRPEIDKRVAEVLELVGLGALGRRRITQLSGGQRQRVALARALASQPDVLLLDEPLSSLDAVLRSQMQDELKDLQQRVGVTTLYVTHDQHEALTMSDELAVMNEGAVVQRGTPEEVYLRPRTRFTASFLGSTTILTGRSAGSAGAGLHAFDTEIGRLRVEASGSFASGHKVAISIRPESVEVNPAAGTPNEDNTFLGRIDRATFVGEAWEYTVAIGGGSLRAKLGGGVPLGASGEVHVTVPPSACVLLDDDAQG